MAHKILETYLRTYRRQAGFSQKEIAYLLGWHSASKISRFEHCRITPNLQTAFSCEVIFHVPVQQLFAGVFLKVEQKTNRRAQLLLRRMKETHPETLTPEKLKLLK